MGSNSTGHHAIAIKFWIYQARSVRKRVSLRFVKLLFLSKNHDFFRPLVMSAYKKSKPSIFVYHELVLFENAMTFSYAKI